MRRRRSLPNLLQKHARQKYDMSSLKSIDSGGNKVTPQLVHAVDQHFRRPTLTTTYDSTEADLVACANPQQPANDPTTVGTPVTGVQGAIRDPQGNPLLQENRPNHHQKPHYAHRLHQPKQETPTHARRNTTNGRHRIRRYQQPTPRPRPLRLNDHRRRKTSTQNQ